MWLKAWVVSRSWAQRAAGDWNRMQTVGVGLPWTDEVLDPLYREYRELEPRAKHKDRPWRGSSVFEIGTKKLCWSLSWKKAGHVPHAMDEKKHKRNLNPNPTPLAGVGLKSQHQCGMGIPSTEINVKTRGKVGNPSDRSWSISQVWMVTNTSTAMKLAFVEKSFHGNLFVVHLPFLHTCGMKYVSHDLLSIVSALFKKIK